MEPWMYGYVRPYKPELKIKEYDRYRAAYCGLCHALKKRHGAAARYLVSYDLAFLVMLLDTGEGDKQFRELRCPASPLWKKSVAPEGGNFGYAADITVILAYHKLCDELADSRGIKKLAPAIALLFVRAMYRKAAKTQPELAGEIAKRLAQLSEYERGREQSLDRTADTFAALLREAAVGAPDEKTKRVLEVILYHTGRFIYIADAVDDLWEDAQTSAYNPVAARFGLLSPEPGDTVRDELRFSLEHSLATAAQAFELLPEGYYTPVLYNIIYIGMPSVMETVLMRAGRKKERTKKRERSI